MIGLNAGYKATQFFTCLRLEEVQGMYMSSISTLEIIRIVIIILTLTALPSNLSIQDTIHRKILNKILVDFLT